MEVSFNGYNSILKQCYKKDLLPTVKFGLYGDVLTKKNVSLEHLIPVSRGGSRTALSNFALTTKEANNLRGNAPLKDFLRPDVAIRYLLQFRDVNIRNLNGQNFSGNRYIAQLLDLFNELGIFGRQVKKVKKNIRFRIDLYF